MTLPPEQYNDSSDQEESPESDDTDQHELNHDNINSKLDPHPEMDIFSFHVGQQIDVLDSVDRWSEAEVLKIDLQNNRIFVSFLYWQSKWDMWVDNILEKTALLHTQSYHPSGPLRLKQRLLVLDSKNTWLEAFVIDERPDEALIHYRNYSPTFDEWIPRTHTHRFRQFGPDKKLKAKAKLWSVPNLREDGRHDVDLLIAHKQQQNPGDTSARPGSSGSAERKSIGSKGSSRQSKQALKESNNIQQQERQRQITEFSERYQHYIQALEAQQLEVYPVEGDGNCMFRAVAHQVYGDERLHALVREKCMDYMQSQAEFYCQFVVGGMQMFPLYVAAKRQNGCWGDDPEIQALCEMYGRPAYIWAYDAQRGAKNLRTFHEAVHSHNHGGVEGGRGGVIRLSYYGGGHYDSIHKFGTFGRKSSPRRSNQEKSSSSDSYDTGDRDTFIRSQPGVLEESAIRRVTQRQRQRESQSQNQNQNNTQAKASSSAGSSGGSGVENPILEQELAQVAEAKRKSEQEASDFDLDLALRASRHDITCWEEQDIETCLLNSIAMTQAEEKSASSAGTSRPSSKSSTRQPSTPDHSTTIGISPRPEGPKRQKMDDNQWESPSATSSPRSESKTSTPSGKQETPRRHDETKHVQSLEDEQREALAESLRLQEEKEEADLRKASELSLSLGMGGQDGKSEQELLNQALQASLEEAYQEQYAGQQYDAMVQSHIQSDEERILNVTDDEDSEDALQKALALSLGQSTVHSGSDQEADLQDALRLSMATSTPAASSTQSTATTNIAGPSSNVSENYESMLMYGGEEEEDPELAFALQNSLQER